MHDRRSIPEKYVAAWHEPDAGKRRAVIDELWAEDCAYYNSEVEFHGRSGIENAVTEAHEEFVRNGFVFTVRTVEVNHDAIRYQWAMSPADGGTPSAVGTHVCTVDGSGRIVREHQFIDPAET